MAREFGVLRAVSPWFAPAPKVYHLCQDASVAGAVFFIMERRHGVVPRDSVPEAIAAFPGYRRRISEGFTDCLVNLHRVDILERNLTALGKPEGFLERQIRGWAERWMRSRTEEIPAMDALSEWLAARMPHSQTATLVHNDYKLDNIMLDAADPGRVEAVLDWEMATVGDPLVDLGIALCYWAPPVSLGAVKCVTEGTGWYSADELIERYARGTGFDVSNARYYWIFAAFKLAVIIQQIYYRYHVGQTHDERFRNFHERVKALAQAGFEMTRG
jgi:aminoglycoside phosphotransferase (APT) family kinase protein